MTPIMMAMVLGTILLLGWNLLRPVASRDPKQPPVVPPSIPFVGHIIGLLRYQGNYLASLSAKYPSWPIFTLEIYSAKVYVATSPDLIRTLYGTTKSLSFFPFTVAFTERVLGARKYVIDALSANGSDNEYMHGIHGAYSALSPGPDLIETNRRALNSLADEFNTIGTFDQSKELLQWMRTSYAISLSKAFYGPDNPILDNPSFIQLIWDFEAGIPAMFLGKFQSILAPKAHRALKTISPAFVEYYNKGLDKNANHFIQARTKAARGSGFTNKDIGDFEITIVFASLTNAVPNAFTMLCNVLADSKLTDEISEEVANVTSKSASGGVTQVTIDTTAFSTKCPLLVAAWQETLRVCVNATSVRAVVEDVVLKDSYAFQKGGVVQLVAGRSHQSEKIWGKDISTFNPRRFLKREDLTREEKRAQTQGLMPWGGGKHLCPGRHFAFTEVVGFVAMVVYGFEVRMKEGLGRVEMPPFKVQQLGENSRNPAHDVEVWMRRKEEFKDVRFGFNVDPVRNEAVFG